MPRTKMRFLASALVSLKLVFVAPLMGVPFRSHWYLMLAPALPWRALTVSVLPGLVVPVTCRYGLGDQRYSGWR